MAYDFSGRRALVTGAGKGIGRDIVLALVGYGAQVVALSRNADDLASLKAETGCETIVADLGDAGAAVRGAEEAGEIDLLINNAGIARLQPFLEATADAFDDLMAVNVRAVMLVSQVVARRLIARGAPGSIVNISSVASVRALPEHATYCASKGALDMLTKVMALELGPHHIRVNSVNPTVVLTPMGRGTWGKPAKGDPMKARIPLGRFAEERDVSEAVAFLLSDNAAMVNGTLLFVDGGFLVQ